MERAFPVTTHLPYGTVTVFFRTTGLHGIAFPPELIQCDPPDISTYVLADVGHLDTAPKTPDQQAATAEKWLREHGFDHLWRSQDIAAVVARYARRWYEEAFLIGAYHPNRNWTCLATATSDIGGRRIFWDVVDGARKYATAVVRRTACVTTITRSISTTRPQPP